MIIGNGILGIGLNVMNTGCPKVAFNWFKPKNSPIVTSILMMAFALGYLVAFILPSMMITLSD